jgi:hypothetical protein
MLLPILGMALMGARFSSKKKKLLGAISGCIMIVGLLFLAACGGSSGGGGGGGGTVSTPAGTYTISISGSAGSTVNATEVTLSVQ